MRNGTRRNRTQCLVRHGVRGLLPVLLLAAPLSTAWGQHRTTFFEFRKRGSIEQRAVVRFMLEGIRAAFTATGKDWPPEIAGALRGCDEGWRETLRAMWEPLTPEKDRKPLEDVLFAGYVDACKRAKVERARAEQRRAKPGAAK